MQEQSDVCAVVSAVSIVAVVVAVAVGAQDQIALESFDVLFNTKLIK
jgi:hypothetical protein